METVVVLLVAALMAAALALAVVVTRAREGAKRVRAETRLAEAEAQIGALSARAEAAAEARLAAERELAGTRQRLAEAERRGQDFERLREESLQAAKAAVFETAQHLSSKLLADHKREAEEVKQDAEERVRRTSETLVKQVDEIARAVTELNAQIQQKGRLVDTVWRSLSSPGGAGQIAEIGLANTLRGFGLEPGRDYILQHTTQDEASGRRLRPDAVVFLPGDCALVIDCKASKFLLEIAEAEGSEREEEAYRNLARTMNLHLKALAEKDYRGAVLASWRESGRGPEITRLLSLMYLPNEGALDKLARADPEFPRKARAAQIIPAGPAGLHCALSLATVEITTLRQIENQQRIVEATQSLLDGMVMMLGHAAALGKGLKGASEGFARLTGSVNRFLLPRARRLAALGVQPAKTLPGNLPAYVVTSLDDTLIDGEAAEIEKNGGGEAGAETSEPPARSKPRLIGE